MDVVDSLDFLKSRARLPAVLSLLRRIPDYQFEIPGLSEAANQVATERLTNYRNACGCFAGGLVMSLAVMGFVALYVVGVRSFADAGAMDLLQFFALFTVSTFAGKALGILWARTRAIQLVRRIATTSV